MLRCVRYPKFVQLLDFRNNMEEVKLARSIPLSILFAGLVHTGGIVWFAAILRADVSTNSAAIEGRKDWIARRELFESDITKQMIRLSVTTEQLAKTSDELNQSVKKLTERVAN